MIPVTYSWPWAKADEAQQKETLKNLADNGFRHLVLSDKTIEACIVTPELIGKHKKALAEFGLDFVDAHAPWGAWKDPGMPLESQHEMVVLRQKMAIRVCHELGVHTMAYHTGNTFNSIFGQDLKLEDYYQMLLRSLYELLPDAERYGVEMCLENQWTPLNQSAYLLKAVEHFNSPWLGICYDAGHANLTEHGQEFPGKTCVPSIWNDAKIPVVWEENMVAKLRPWIVNCHFHDNNGIVDEHKLVGQGTVDWNRIMNTLKDAPRLKCIQSEVGIREAGPTMQELRTAFAGLCDWLDA